VFEVQNSPGLVRVISGGQSANETRDDIAGNVAYFHPLNSVEFDSIELDFVFVFAKLAAVKYVKYLVALGFAWRPVVNQQAFDSPVESQFFPHFAFAGGRWRFAAIDVAAGNIPTVTVGLADQKNPVAVNKERARCETGCREIGYWVSHHIDPSTFTRVASLSSSTDGFPVVLRIKSTTTLLLK
jgi:hypothetical protein